MSRKTNKATSKATTRAMSKAKKPRSRAAARTRKATVRARKPALVEKAGGLTVREMARLDDLRRELQRITRNGQSPARWNADADDVQRSVAQLVLTLVEFIRRLLERQAIRRMEAGTLDGRQTEEIGLALMKLEATVVDIAAKFSLSPDDLNLDLGPVGKLM